MELIQEADRSKWIAHSNHNIKCFTKGDIERMTNSYRTILGRGAFGEVYEGVLEDESMVAVKRLNGSVEEKFAKELIVHREINHKNVVRLIGYCAEENALMLVMEYIANGNLSDVLHDDNHRPIPLDIRLRIAIDCAEALAYMHSHMYTQVIHGDIKPGNILLDRNFHAKLSDFGISRLANTDKTLRTENVIGSIGYMDPLFSLDGRVTVQYDVYSFGAVLVELITRRKAVVDNVNNVYAFNNALTRGVRGLRKKFDVDIASKSNNMKVLEGVARLAGECLRMDRDKRPKMIDVAERLRVLLKSQGRQRVDLFSWVRKSIPAPPPSVNIPANILPSDVYRQFSFAELQVATNNFDEPCLLDSDPDNMMYKGVLEGNIEVAVQRCTSILERSVEKFIKKVLILSQINHKNIVKLLGFWMGADLPVLVYEFIPNRSLFQLIHANHRQHFSLATRLQIAYESAEALSYLRCWARASPPIIHGNVKSLNILIDSDYTAKVFCSCIPARTDEEQFDTVIYGTSGYIDPYYLKTGRLTEKSDVYSFGVVLLELLTRRRAYKLDGRESEMSLALHFMDAMRVERLEEILDDEIKNDENMEVIEEMAELAKRCLEFCAAERPSMKEVSVMLDRLRQVAQHQSTQHSLERTEFLLGELSMA